ncbi:MAG: DinB family protein [Firmicutes bacterium]|nr:DinB family protein [Bacillota bacterium]
MSELLVGQYDLVRKTRQSLFAFLESVPVAALHTEVPGFGFGTIARTHLHVAGCYMHWLVGFAGIRSKPEYPTEEETRSTDVAMLRRWFSLSDEVVEEFLNAFGTRSTELIHNESEGPIGLSPLWLMTHTMTHEFHHKGQIVSLARNLGYAPPDTDLVYPDNE